MADTPKSQDDLSIEEILGSIRRIIAEDEDQPEAASAAPVQPQAAAMDDEEDEAPLELTNKIDPDGTIQHVDEEAPLTQPTTISDDIVFQETPATEIMGRDDMITMEPAPAFAEEPRQERTQVQEEPVAMTQREENPAPSEPLLSSTTAIATAAVMAKLARQAAINEEGNGSVTIEAMVREMLKPMLREWLDANLPDLVQKMVERELERLTKRL